MDVLIVILILLAVAAGAMLWHAKNSNVIFDYQQAIKYVDGKFAGVAGPGRYLKFGKRRTFVVQDMRSTPLVVSGQDVPTKDNISVRISLVGHYQVTDIKKALHETYSFQSEVHTAAQLAVRDAVAQLTLDELLSSRSNIDKAVVTALSAFPQTHGVEVKDLAVRDIVLPANLKKAMAGVVEAQKEAQRNLEKVRGEHAVLRHLANAAKLYQEHPQLLNARLVQSLENGQNTIVFGGETAIPGLAGKNK